jgi:hypothetical protein
MLASQLCISGGRNGQGKGYSLLLRNFRDTSGLTMFLVGLTMIPAKEVIFAGGEVQA